MRYAEIVAGPHREPIAWGDTWALVVVDPSGRSLVVRAPTREDVIAAAELVERDTLAATIEARRDLVDIETARLRRLVAAERPAAAIDQGPTVDVEQWIRSAAEAEANDRGGLPVRIRGPEDEARIRAAEEKRARKAAKLQATVNPQERL